MHGNNLKEQLVKMPTSSLRERYQALKQKKFPYGRLMVNHLKQHVNCRSIDLNPPVIAVLLFELFCLILSLIHI